VLERLWDEETPLADDVEFCELEALTEEVGDDTTLVV